MTAFDYLVNGLPDDFVCEDYTDMYMVVGNITDWLGNRSVKLLNGLVSDDNCYMDRSGNTIYEIGKEYADKLKSIEVTFDEGTEDYTGTRRPYYQLRGKPVSEEQALEFIRLTDIAFWDCGCTEEKPQIHWISMRSNLFTNCYSDGLVHPNGVVGMNGIMSKYPDFCELFAEFVGLAAAFPFLDFVIAVSSWDELSPEEWKKMWDSAARHSYYEAPPSISGFTENLEIGVWVHEGKVEFLSPDNASKKYKEYEKLYGAADAKIYCNKPYGDPELADFFVKCLESNGVSGKEINKRLDKFKKDQL